MQSSCPARVWPWTCSAVNRPDSCNIPASWRWPSKGPERLAINPFGVTNDWNFNAWTRLWPLYTTRWFSSGRAIGRTVPSTKPKQFGRGDPIQRIAWAYCSRHTEERKGWFQDVRWWPWFSNTHSNTTLCSIQSSGTGRAKRWIISKYLQGYAKRLRRMQSPSSPLHTVPWWHLNRAGIRRAAAKRGRSALFTLKLAKHSSNSNESSSKPSYSR